MSETTAGSGLPHAHSTNTLSIPFVIGATLLAVLGTISVLFFVITFQWIYFLGVVPAVVGALLFFSPRAGSDHA